ncbi:MAG TPA: SAM-dependent chlorinase/fluorinase [Bacteroidales bacterium]|nr:SAM-dependent chlorinase/fluorinase [Bacteroidales bacterium]
MAVITLTTEWRPDDFYYGIMKGKLCSGCPGAVIIDNANSIPVFNISHASFIIRNTYSSYPKGTIHIVCVHSEGSNDRNHLIVRARDHYFIGTDNGMFNLILNSPPDEVVRLKENDRHDELDLFAKAASELAQGRSMSEIGEPLPDFTEKIPLRATIDKDVIIGSIIFIDSYGNAISNITREVFYRVFEKKPFQILIQSNKNHTDHISTRYNDEPVGELLARFNSLDLLEIAINGANISELLSLSIGSAVRVDIPEKKSVTSKLF